MIMMGLKFCNDVPFREVYIHGLVRDAHGQKMSKSKGNILDPIDLIDGIDLETLVKKRTTGLMQPEMAPKIDKLTRQDFPQGIPAFGTDALRFTFASLASTGRDINFDMGRIEGYRNFCNKLWNAARFVMLNTEGQSTSGERELSLPDRWINTRLQHAAQQVQEAYAGYRFDMAAQAIYEFIWNEYCDWYLELSKPVLNGTDSSEAMKRGTRHNLLAVLEAALRLAHPLIPYITEEIWQRVAPLAGGGGDTIMRQPYPLPDASAMDAEAAAEMNWVQTFILGVRRIRSGMDIAPGKLLPVLLQNGAAADRQLLEKNRGYICAVGRIESVRWLAEGETAPEAATALLGEMKVLIPMAGLINKEAEQARLDREISKLGQDYERVRAKLANSGFVDKAPAAVVDKEKARMAELESALEKLRAQLERIARL